MYTLCNGKMEYSFVACSFISILFNLYVDDPSSQASKAGTKLQLNTVVPGKQNKSTSSKKKPNGMLWPCSALLQCCCTSLSFLYRVCAALGWGLFLEISGSDHEFNSLDEWTN